MVPTFTWGFDRSNFSFAIFSTPKKIKCQPQKCRQHQHRTWCPWAGSNCRPLPYQGSALPLSHMGKTLYSALTLERETGIEPASSAWKAGVLPLNYSRITNATEWRLLNIWWRRLDSNQRRRKPTDLQSAPFSHSGTPPGKSATIAELFCDSQALPKLFCGAATRSD